MQRLFSDLKQALRLFRTSPGFAAAVIAATALGVGTNTAIFSVVNTVVLKPVPFPEPDRIVQLHLAGGRYDGELARDTHSAPVPAEVWDLLDHLMTHASPRASLLERNSEFPDDFAEIAADLRRARRIVGGVDAGTGAVGRG